MRQLKDEQGLIEELSRAYDVPLLDIQLMALNLYGIASNIGDNRARMKVYLDADPTTEWHLIVPTSQPMSPYELIDNILFCFGKRIAFVRLVEHDDARLGYARVGEQVLTLNTNKRSTCTGCVFCPNTLADSNDPRLSQSEDEIRQWLSAFLLEHGWSNLSSIREINLSTGCFGEESKAISHLTELRVLLNEFSFRGRLGILSSVIQTDEGMKALAELSPFALFITLECVTRRDLLLKESKASLQPAEAVRVLMRAREADVDTGVMLVVGLDPLSEATNWLSEAVPYLTDFPNLQIFQSHSPYMNLFRTKGAEALEFFLTARHNFESILLPTSLRPQRWQNYRPLWYYKFGSEELLPCPY
ncbi:radical SAM protein [Coleofasciculus sp.]|uniref:radical SAM protein n=1 Tax=Coleofasciculus sp. TaxID=3100458 RepID=UPI0039F98ADB